MQEMKTLTLQFETLEELGKGTYGRVYRVRRKSDGTIFVRKQVSLEGMSDEDRKETLNEARVMSKCDHFNIIKYYESFIEDNHLHIIMEYASGGDLSKKIKAQNMVPFKEEVVWNYLIQISQGLQYLHKNRILHRDIKPQNIFLDKDDNVKIGDMGLGRILGPQSTFAYTGVGTPLYFSPELCNEKPYNQKGDIWSFGCLLYELICFRPPFIASNQLALAKKICNEEPPPLPKDVPKELHFLIMKMLEKDPAKRPDIEHILNYSGVRIRIQSAKLRHKELKMQEEFVFHAKRMQTEYTQKIDGMQSLIDKQKIQISDLRRQVEIKDIELRRQAEANKNLQEKLKLYEDLERRRAVRTPSPSYAHGITPQSHQQRVVTPPRDRLQSPNRRHNLIGESPNSKYYDREKTKDIQSDLDSLQSMIDLKKMIQENRRPKSAPATPEKIPIVKVKKSITPGPNRFASLQLIQQKINNEANQQKGEVDKDKRIFKVKPPLPDKEPNNVAVAIGTPGKENKPQLSSEVVGQVLQRLKRKKSNNTPDVSNANNRNLSAFSFLGSPPLSSAANYSLISYDSPTPAYVTPEKAKRQKMNQLFRERMNAESEVFDQQKKELFEFNPADSIDSSNGAALLRKLRQEMRSKEERL